MSETSTVSPAQLPARERKGGHDSNRVERGDLPAHDWYRFVLSYPPHLVRAYLERFGLEPGACVLDPFCGTGTTPVECKRLGITSVGVEANPMAFFASATKTDWEVDPDKLEHAALRVGERALSVLEKDGIIDDPQPNLTRMFEEGVLSPLRRLSAEEHALLLANSRGSARLLRKVGSGSSASLGRAATALFWPPLGLSLRARICSPSKFPIPPLA